LPGGFLCYNKLMDKKIFLVCVGVVASFFGIHADTKLAYAASGTWYQSCVSQAGLNMSMNAACEYCDSIDGNSRWGAAWISEAGSDYKSDVINAGTRSVVNIEVRGLYYQCGHSGGSGNDMASDDVFLTSEEGSHERDVDFISLSGSSLYRGSTRIMYTWSSGGGHISGTLDTAAMRAWGVAHGYEDCGTPELECVVLVYIHRTPRVSAVEGWSPSTIRVTGGTYNGGGDGGGGGGGGCEGSDCDSSVSDTCELPSNLTSSASSNWDNGINGGRSAVASGVKNLSTSNIWKATVYARPDNKIQFGHCFYSGAQEVRVDEGCADDCSCSEGTRTKLVSNSNHWSIGGVSDLSAAGSSASYGADNAIHGYNSIGRVGGEDVGDDYTQSASTSSNSIYTYTTTHDCECNECACGCTPAEGEESCEDPMNCDCGLSHSAITSSSYSDGNDSDSARVVVPYNFYLSGSVAISGTVFAGEAANVTARATVNQRFNGHEDIDSTYATRADEVKVKLITFASDSNQTGMNSKIYSGTTGGVNGDLCNYFSFMSVSGQNRYCDVASADSSDENVQKIKSSYTLNSDGDTDGSTDTVIDSGIFAAYDIPAGKYFCVSVAVYPANSGAYTNYNDTSGSDGWAISPSTCVVVAKKPAFQVWGGNIFINGKSTVYSIAKNSLHNNFSKWTDTYAYGISKINPVRYYSSWDELAIIMTDGSSASGIASGAASGYTTNSNGSLESNPAGSSKAIYTLNHLTIPNTDSATQTKAKSYSSTKENLISDYIDNNKAKSVSGSINLADAGVYNVEKTENSETRRTYASGDITISSTSELPMRTTHIISSDGTITIDNNLIYNQNTYVSTTQVPQYLIYAKGNINIVCQVTEINAILITNGKINTCADGGDTNDRKRSNQLVIKGAIIADQMVFGRTYGASIGAYSEIPAEIIDADPTAYLWGISKATKTPTLSTAFLKELAPRY